MKNQNNNTFFTDAVESISEKLNLPTREAWNTMYELGFDFIDTLQIRVHRKRVFDLQFRTMLEKSNFAELSLLSVFAEIKKSPDFWEWWATKMFFACSGTADVSDQASLMYALEFTESIIPIFTLNKIFYGKHQKQGSCQAVDHVPATPSATIAIPPRTTGSKVGSRV